MFVPELAPEVKERFLVFKKKWENISLCPISANLMIAELRDIFKSTIVVSQSRDFEQHYYRVRKGSIDDITNPKEFSYPPAKFSGPGRCNLKNRPVFYGAESALVALEEVGVEVGEECYLSLWSSGDNFPKYAQYIWTRYADSERLRAHYNRRKDIYMNMEPVETSIAILWFLEVLTELFVSDTHTVSSALSYDALYQKGFDGIEYLDAKSRKWYNFALSTDFADKLKLKAVYHVFPSDENSITYISIGTEVDGQIDWKPYSDSHFEELNSGIRRVDESGREV